MEQQPQKGRFGKHGGQYVPEMLMGALEELEAAYEQAMADPAFTQQFEYYLREYVGRPSPLYLAERVSEQVGARVYLKREDLNHTGAHKINNTMGQGLLARRMGKPRVIAETGAGQHGVATATVAALFGMECVVYMGIEDIRRQELNCFRMQLLGATVEPVSSGQGTLSDALDEAMRDWLANSANTFYVLGTVCGPHPYPTMVREFQKVIGSEVKQQIMQHEGRLPTKIFACVGGGSNAMGIFHEFVDDPRVELIGCEAAGLGLDTERHAATLAKGTYGVLHGAAEYVLQDEDGQVMEAYSVSAGLDYPGVGPEHCHLQDMGRAQYVAVTDTEALDAFCKLSELEGIIPALESSHAVAEVFKRAGQFSEEDIIVVNLSGRGDKDANEVKRILNGRGK